LFLEFSSVGIELLLAFLGLIGLFSLLLFDDSSLGVQFFFRINEFLACSESFLLSSYNSSGGNFFLDLGFNTGDGCFNFKDEFLQVFDLEFNNFLSAGEEINFFLGGNLE